MGGGYKKYGILNNDELVIQKIDDEKFKLTPEKLFLDRINFQISKFENDDFDNIDDEIEKISRIVNIDRKSVIQNEFIKISNESISERKKILKPANSRKENVPSHLRKILLDLYNGKCQLTNWTFIQKNGNPYFEIHHIDADKGNHVKNLLVVCPNIHAQFTSANIKKQVFDEKGWLRKVEFDDSFFNVFQIIDKMEKRFEKEMHF